MTSISLHAAKAAYAVRCPVGLGTSRPAPAAAQTLKRIRNSVRGTTLRVFASANTSVSVNNKESKSLRTMRLSRRSYGCTVEIPHWGPCAYGGNRAEIKVKTLNANYG
eukprot:21766-Prorocentrum_minimum.AAC.2